MLVVYIVNSMSLPFISPNPAILYQSEKQDKTAFQVGCFKQRTKAEQDLPVTQALLLHFNLCYLNSFFQQSNKTVIVFYFFQFAFFQLQILHGIQSLKSIFFTC